MSAARRLLLALLTVASCAACDRLPGKPDRSDLPVDPRTMMGGAALYARHCAGCHGADGTLGAARPLNDPLYIAFVGRERLEAIIEKGVPGTLMPAFGSNGLLSAEQGESLAAWVVDSWGQPAPAEELPPYEAPALAGDELAASIERGAEVFAQACARCHEDGGGVTDPSFLALVSDQSLRTTVVCGRPDLDKPDWRSVDDGEPLSEQQIDDVTRWLASHRTPHPGRPFPTSAQQRILQDD